MNKTHIAIVSMLLLVCLAVRGGDDPKGKPAPIFLRQCTIEYERASKLGAPSWGFLQDCFVKPGDRVKADQILGRLFDKDIRAEMELHAAQADTDIEVRLYQKKYESAKTKAEFSSSVYQRKAGTLLDAKITGIDAETAKVEAEYAQFRRKLAGIQAQQAAAVIRSKAFVAPFDGVVVTIDKQPGESVAPNTSVFYVVDTSVVRLIGMVDITDLEHIALNDPVKVWPEVGGADLSIEQKECTGKIVFIDSFVDPKSQTCKIYVQLDNRDGTWRAGMTARAEIVPSTKTPAAAQPEGKDKANGAVAVESARKAEPTAVPTPTAKTNSPSKPAPPGGR